MKIIILIFCSLFSSLAMASDLPNDLLRTYAEIQNFRIPENGNEPMATMYDQEQWMIAGFAHDLGENGIKNPGKIAKIIVHYLKLQPIQVEAIDPVSGVRISGIRNYTPNEFRNFVGSLLSAH